MEPHVIQQLNAINHHFYETFASAFAATRRRIQPGIRKLLSGIPLDGRWLDLGCGSGALALDWAGSGRSGIYLGLDFSEGMLAEARKSLTRPIPPGLEIGFKQADLSQPGWVENLKSELPFDGILALAVLHHIPGSNLRRILLEQVRSLLPVGSYFYHSVWQFQNSSRLLGRVLPWETVQLSVKDLERGDTLLDWRYAVPGQVEQTGLRYVHLFDRTELAKLAAKTGFSILSEFESDGQGGRLGLYQAWRAV